MALNTGRHAEIARRYRKGERESVPFVTIRVGELQRLFRDRCGPVLPDDDAGRDDARIVAHHLARGRDAEHRIGLWLRLWAPWMPNPDVDKMISKVIAKPIKWGADTLGKRLGLTEVERKRLAITTIGSIEVTKAERLVRRRRRRRDREEHRRRARGAKARAEYETNSISRNKPWEALGISRITWYRRGKPTA